MAVQGLRLHTSDARGMGSIPHPGIKILHALQHSQKIKNKINNIFMWFYSHSCTPSMLSKAGIPDLGLYLYNKQTHRFPYQAQPRFSYSLVQSWARKEPPRHTTPYPLVPLTSRLIPTSTSVSFCPRSITNQLSGANWFQKSLLHLKF